MDPSSWRRPVSQACPHRPSARSTGNPTGRPHGASPRVLPPPFHQAILPGPSQRATLVGYPSGLSQRATDDPPGNCEGYRPYFLRAGDNAIGASIRRPGRGRKAAAVHRPAQHDTGGLHDFRAMILNIVTQRNDCWQASEATIIFEYLIIAWDTSTGTACFVVCYAITPQRGRSAKPARLPPLPIRGCPGSLAETGRCA
jgi:hypothetical protein